MKKILIFSILLFAIVFELKAQTGVNTRNPNASANMEVFSSNKGLLIPRLSVPNVLLKAPVVATPKDGLLIYNTNTATKKTLFHWDATANNNNGSWNSHLFFKETPKTAVIGMIGPDFPALNNVNAGQGTYITNVSGNALNIQSSGYMPNLSVGNYSSNVTRLAINMGAGVYMIEISYLITAPVPDAGRGSVLTGTTYYNMAYYTDIYVDNIAVSDFTIYTRVERAVVAEAGKNHRVTFNATFTLPENAASPIYQLFTLFGRRSGSTHNDLVNIIPSGTYYKLTKLK